MWCCGAELQENLSSPGQLQSVVIVEVEWKFSRDRVIVPYTKWRCLVGRYPSNAGHVKSGMNLGRPLSKAKYSPMTDSEPVP
jgi:hypothetical protein